MDDQFTFEELLLGLPKLVEYIGKEMCIQILKGETKLESLSKKTPDEILNEINNFKR